MLSLREFEDVLGKHSPAEKAQVRQWLLQDLGDAFPGIESRPGVCGGEACIVRDYTTVSRQVSKLDSLSLVTRRPSQTDNRTREAAITAKGQEVTGAIDSARERLAPLLSPNGANAICRI